jgi:hypothetical protein
MNKSIGTQKLKAFLARFPTRNAEQTIHWQYIYPTIIVFVEGGEWELRYGNETERVSQSLLQLLHTSCRRIHKLLQQHDEYKMLQVA